MPQDYMDRCMIDSFDPPDLYSLTVVDYDRNRRKRIDGPLIVTGGDSARIRCVGQIAVFCILFPPPSPKAKESRPPKIFFWFFVDEFVNGFWPGTMPWGMSHAWTGHCSRPGLPFRFGALRSPPGRPLITGATSHHPFRSSYFDFSCTAFHTGAGAADAVAKYFPSLAGQAEVVVCYGDVTVAKELAEFVEPPPKRAPAPARQAPTPLRAAMATSAGRAATGRSDQPVWSSEED